MYQSNIVVFKGKKDGIVIMLDETADYDELKSMLALKVSDASKFFGGEKMSITFTGRNLTEDEEAELLEIVLKKSNLNVSFVNEKQEPIKSKIEPNEKAVSQQPRFENEMPIPSNFNPLEHMATFYKGSLRSGKSIKFSGSVVVIGDINPGAEIIAEGNIIVLGTINGLVHAGCAGDDSCFVSALCLSPVQLRIADRATYIPDEIKKRNRKKPVPSYAYIQDGQIYITPMM